MIIFFPWVFNCAFSRFVFAADFTIFVRRLTGTGLSKGILIADLDFDNSKGFSSSLKALNM